MFKLKTYTKKIILKPIYPLEALICLQGCNLYTN